MTARTTKSKAAASATAEPTTEQLQAEHDAQQRYLVQLKRSVRWYGILLSPRAPVEMFMSDIEALGDAVESYAAV